MKSVQKNNMNHCMSSPRFIFIALLLCLNSSGCAASEVNSTISSTAAGANCDIVAIAIMRATLRYPLLEGMGTGSRGIPTYLKNSADLYLFHTSTKKLELATSVDAPSRWRASSRYAIQPRVLPNGTVIFMTRGCPPDNENCNESHFFQLGENGKYTDLAVWPDASKQESANLNLCTSYLSYEDNNSVIKINTGPRGGPWKPVLVFTGGQLTPVK
jgi:hypothetical protein